jgi:predicted nucleotidyltransferase
LHSDVIKSIDSEKIHRAVHRYARDLRQNHPEILRIIWFGSWVNGLPSPGSDVDLCLIVSQAEAPCHARASQYLPVGFPTGVDILVYTLEEFRQLNEISPGLWAALHSGIDV